MGSEISQLLSRVSSLVSRWNLRENQMLAWLSGPANGGPSNDGRFPITDGVGEVHQVLSPQALADTVSGPANDAEDAKAAAEEALNQAQEERRQAASLRDACQTLKGEADQALENIRRLRDDTNNSANKAMNYRDQAREARDDAQAAKESITE